MACAIVVLLPTGPATRARAQAEATSAEPDTSAAHAPRTPTPTPTEDKALPLAPQVTLGGGVGRRGLSWPSAGQTLRVDTGTYAALALGVAWPFSVGPSFTLGPAFAYQTSLGQRVDERHVTGPVDSLRVRAHRLEAVLEAGFGARTSVLQLGLGLGYATHDLRPEVHHLQTPSYSLAGPLARLSARVRMGSIAALYLAPEAQLAFVGDDLEARGLAATGFGVGGEVALELTASAHFAIVLALRDTHIWLAARGGGTARDDGQLGTLRLAWQP